MTIEIQSEAITPRRHTFGNLARRFGEDRPASRYEEATADLQPTDNFHYRPLWDPAHAIFDQDRTAIRMADWYAFADPRQFYYGTWTISRAGMIQTAERNLKLIGQRGLFDAVAPVWRQTIADYLIPLRHYEWGANMNNLRICDEGYGTQITSAAGFCAADRLGLAQHISLIGLALDGGQGDSLDTAKTAWLDAAHWQGVRRLVEDSLVVDDWFELFVAQNLAMDGVLHPLVFDRFEEEGMARGAVALPLGCAFVADWRADIGKWVDAIIRIATAESEANRALLSGWYRAWRDRAAEAAAPLAAHVLDTDGAAACAQIVADLDTLAARLGIETEAGA